MMQDQKCLDVEDDAVALATGAVFCLKCNCVRMAPYADFICDSYGSSLPPEMQSSLPS